MTNIKVKTELGGWITEEDRIVDRRVVDDYGTEIVILRSADAAKTGEERYRVLRGFTLGDGAGVSVDVADKPMEDVLAYFLKHYSL